MKKDIQNVYFECLYIFFIKVKKFNNLCQDPILLWNMDPDQDDLASRVRIYTDRESWIRSCNYTK